MDGIANIACFIAGHPLTRDQKLRAFGRVVRWQVESRLQREVIVPWIAGTRLAVRHGMAGATGNIYCGLHEFVDMAFVLHFLRPDDVFVDVGANIGSYSVLASGVCRARSFAFEPDPFTFEALKRNIAVNGLDALVRPLECALGPRQGQIEFTVGLDSVNRVANDTVGQTRTVLLDTLDHALDESQPSLIKMDVEGFEGEVLRGAKKTLSRLELKAVITEDRSAPVKDALQTAGFLEHSYDPFTRRLHAKPTGGQGQNALFVRDEAFVRQRLIGATRILILNKSL